MGVSSNLSAPLIVALVLGGLTGPVHAARCTMIGNVLHCDGGLSATQIGNVWHLDDGRTSSSAGETPFLRDGSPQGMPAFERRPDARCKQIGPMEFCAQSVRALPK